jgi:hypothetical protein
LRLSPAAQAASEPRQPEIQDAAEDGADTVGIPAENDRMNAGNRGSASLPQGETPTAQIAEGDLGGLRH